MAIKEIEKYLSEFKFKYNGFKEISSQLYDKFIDSDDKTLIKLIKRLLIIYKRFHSKLLQRMLHKWQIITLKLNYGIFDYIDIDLDTNKTTNIKSNKNKNKVYNLENELDEPELESKPKLLFKKISISKNSKNKNSESKNSKNESNIKAMKIKKENDIRSQRNKNNITNIKKINFYSTLNDKENRKRATKIKRDFIPISNQKKKKLNKAKDNNDDEQHNETFKSRTFEGSAKNKKENLRKNKKYYSNEGSNHAHNKKIKNLIIPINNRKKSNFDRSNITYQSDFNLNFGMDKSRSVDTVERKTNISNIMSSKTKPWAYSYKRSQNDEDTILKIKKKRPLMSNTERQELFNKLYNDSKKRKEKFKKLSMEKEAKFNAMYTFTPMIVPNKLNDMYLKNMADSKFSLNTNATTYYNNGGNTSMITTTNNYSLLNRVDINKNYNLPIVLEENKCEVPVDFITRLSEYEKIKKINLEKIKNEVDMNTIGNFNKNRNKHYLRRIPYNNIENSQYYFEKRQKNLDKIVQNIYEEQGITFHPKTNKSYNNKIKNDIIERNKEFMKDKQEKLLKYYNIKEKECTFKPKINNLSTISILNNSKSHHQSNLNYKTDQNTSDVSKRLFDYQNKYKEKLEDIRSKYKENYSFKPEISKNTNIILNNKKRMMEQIKENEMNIINNIREQEGDSNNNIDANENENGNENYNENDNENDNDNGNENRNDYENENNSDNNYSNENKNVIVNNFMKNNFNNDINKQLSLKQMKLDKLEEIPKRISELSEENMAYTDQKLSSKKKNEEDKKIINNKSSFDNKKILYKENSNFQINSLTENKNRNYDKISNISNNNKNMSNVNSDKILELAQNLLNEDLISKKMNEICMDDNEKMNYYNNNNNGSKQSTNDFYSIMMNNSKASGYNDSRIHKKSYYNQEYDFDYINGNRRIMDLNYYDNLL